MRYRMDGRGGAIVNRIKCAQCNDLIHSKHRHDFVSCKCGCVAVDGGDDYRKVCGFMDDIIIVDDDGNESKLTADETVAK